MYRLVRPLLFRLSPETAHNVTFRGLRALGPVARWVAGTAFGSPDPRLRVDVGGLSFAGPIGLAAGLDKNGVLARFWPNLGFGAIELGTVTALAQAGNPKPRLFRFPAAKAVVNRMGFNNAGSAALAQRLSGLRSQSHASLGVNLGKSKVTALEEAAQDYATSASRVRDRCDYLVINVSSPNTPGLRQLQDADHLKGILAAVVAEAGGKPVFVKLAPDLTEEALTDAIAVAENGGAAGIIATNTTIERTGLTPEQAQTVGAGGLSGAPLQPRALEVIGFVARNTHLPVIGVGGISTVDHVLAALRAGAVAVQLYSAFIYEGPGLIHRLNKGLIQRMEQAGVADLAALVHA